MEFRQINGYENFNFLFNLTRIFTDLIENQHLFSNESNYDYLI